MIDVIVTCFNEERHIADAIHSVIAQTASELISAIIVVDDGSTDTTPEIVELIAREKPIITFIRQANQGVSAARNAGLVQSKSDFVAFLDGDDIWLPSKLEEQIKTLESQSCDMVYTGFRLLDSRGQLGKVVTPRKLSGAGKKVVIDLYLWGAPILPSTVLFRRSIKGRVQLFDQELRQAEDTDYWLRYLQDGRVELCDGPLVQRRVHENSLSFDIQKHYSFQFPLLDKIDTEIPWLKKYRKRRLTMIHAKLLKRQLRDAQYRKAVATFRQLAVHYIKS